MAVNSEGLNLSFPAIPPLTVLVTMFDGWMILRLPLLFWHVMAWHMESAYVTENETFRNGCFTPFLDLRDGTWGVTSLRTWFPSLAMTTATSKQHELFRERLRSPLLQQWRDPCWLLGEMFQCLGRLRPDGPRALSQQDLLHAVTSWVGTLAAPEGILPLTESRGAEMSCRGSNMRTASAPGRLTVPDGVRRDRRQQWPGPTVPTSTCCAAAWRWGS